MRIFIPVWQTEQDSLNEKVSHNGFKSKEEAQNVFDKIKNGISYDEIAKFLKQENIKMNLVEKIDAFINETSYEEDLDPKKKISNQIKVFL